MLDIIHVYTYISLPWSFLEEKHYLKVIKQALEVSRFFLSTLETHEVFQQACIARKIARHVHKNTPQKHLPENGKVTFIGVFVG